VNLKTLIILDTNKIRSMRSGGASYGSFEFGAEYNDLKSFINENGLSEFIEIAIPGIALQELLQQKVEQYLGDMQHISEIQRRLSELPGVSFSGVMLPGTGFDCKGHLTPRMTDFIHNSALTVIDIEEEKFGHTLKEVMRRAVERQPPFRMGRNSADIGFKDVMIWESILNYGGYDRYDKVILFTADSGFNEKCKAEFESKVRKPMVITPLMESLQAEIEKDYAFLIENKEWRDFVATDYFKSYLSGELSTLEYVTVDGIERKVIRVIVTSYLDDVEEPEDSEETGISTVLVASLKVTVEIDGRPKEVVIKARTFLDEARDIQYTEFGAE
jgi:hypothetical protein